MLIKSRTKTILFLLLFIFVLVFTMQTISAKTATLVPNSNYLVNWDSQSGAGQHWELVDDYPSDDDTTWIRQVAVGTVDDIFDLENSAISIGQITNVTVFMRARNSSGIANRPYLRATIVTGGLTFYSATTFYPDSTWTTGSRYWAINPKTGNSWTWTEINNLRAGVFTRVYTSANNMSCTQVYVNVSYYLYPENLNATAVNCSMINVTWDSVDENFNSTIVRKSDSCPVDVSDGVVVYNGSGNFYLDTALNCSQNYCYSAWGWNGISHTDNFSCVCECTPPCQPWNLSYNTTIHTNGTLSLQINWTKGDCANRTIIRRSADTPPIDPSDGELIYNGTGTTYTDSYIGQAYYYTLFSHHNQSPCQKYSLGVPLEWEVILINAYNETDGSDIINFSVFFSNADGTDTYSQDNCNNPQMIPIGICPTGDNIAVQVSADGYDTRFYYLDINPSGAYTINAYLPPSSETYVYLITVVDPYDLPVENAYVVFKHYDNATGTYVTVSSLWTDANGQVNLELISSEIYKIIVTKTGYTTEIVDYVPSPAIYTFTIKLQIADVPPESIETLFDGINWSIYPDERYHTNNITIYFNITSSDNKLEWFRALVYWYNETTAVWDLLYSQNISVLPGGSSISYTTPNVTGRYAVKCYFKKQNFTEYEVTQEGSRLFFIEWGGLGTNPGFIAIPNWIYLLITTLIMMVVMAFLLPYAGLATGYVGIGIFGFALSLKPDLAMAGGLVSGWFILIITAIVYTLVLFLWSRI